MEQLPKEQRQETESASKTVPSIYVASLSDYNNGYLHGQWIDARLDQSEIHEQITAMLAQSRDPGAEEFAIHDYEGFSGFEVHEYESIETVHAIAAGIDEHGEAFAAYIDLVGTEQASMNGFEDCFQGTYASLAAFVDSFVEDMGWPEQLEKFREHSGMGSYVSIDYSELESMFRMEWDIIDGHNGVHIFNR
ncbi:antirestriction protein ArdA [Rhodococcus sp. 1139]|jgi:antirestriction protein|uniref:antirestriction protein ArdA n=1 Tax=Rhodococcus sp. 1139 TaxID=1833762 RepID=UPI000871BFA0|nr:antirestriction protein ArdA [Rhodococcus sp. 1139]OFE08238.1 hypothetical protein A5N83_13800 [Rhodococcus sp. 1139]